MKFSKYLLSIFMSLSIIFNVMSIPVFAHNAILDVDYDNCLADLNEDGILEAWYVLNQTSHISDQTQTIKYYFEENFPNTSITWVPPGQNSDIGEEIKAAYASSLEKWNNIYFYSYNQDGTIEKNKLINVVEGTASDHNLSIYPLRGLPDTIALTRPLNGSDELIIESDGITHAHYSHWEMFVNIDYFYLHGQLSEEFVNSIRSRNGAHELGHVLGLLDVDHENMCNSEFNEQHHYELLMGYGADLLNRTLNITYKDIAGVAITRGFHSDNDHKWLDSGIYFNGNYKLICSICNGVKYVSSLDELTYDNYEACGNNHSLSSGNMMAVASYGTQDYYKCKYCRYVAPFSSIVPQDYSITYYTDWLHKIENTVDGLEYMYYEEHSLVNNDCTVCGAHIHSYTKRYEWQTNVRHKAYCECGEYITAAHVVAQGGFPNLGGLGICLLCRGEVKVGVLNNAHSQLAHTDNGSYILPDGIIVLVNADINAYLTGTLEFYYGEKE